MEIERLWANFRAWLTPRVKKNLATLVGQIKRRKSMYAPTDNRRLLVHNYSMTNRKQAKFTQQTGEM